MVLFIGVDPGTTVGYAIFDTDDGKIKLFSKKELSADYLIQKLEKYGKISVIATDKKKLPSFVRTISTKLGAIIFTPKDDILVKEKVSLTKNIDYKNSHERDAAAAVIMAFFHHKNKINEMYDFLSKNDKQELANAFIDASLKSPDLNYLKILNLLEPKPEIKPTKKPLKDNLTRTQTPDEKNILIRKLQKDNAKIIKQNIYLKEQLTFLKKRYENLHKKTSSRPKERPNKQLMDILTMKEKRIMNLVKDLSFEKKKSTKLSAQTDRIIKLMNDNKYLFLLTLPDLRNPLPKSNQTIFIEDINVYTEKAIKSITSEHILLSPKQITKKLRKFLPCIYLDWSNAFYETIRDITVVKRVDYENKFNAIDDFEGIINDYQDKRRTELSSE